MSLTCETPDRSRNSKRALSSPDNELDSEHKRAYHSIMESPLASQLCEPTISLSEEAIQKISDTLIATFRVHIETIVENVVTSVISKLTSKLDLLEDVNTKLCIENSELKAKVNLLELKLDDQEQYSRRNLVRISGIEEHKGENTDDLVLDLSRKIGSNLTLTELDRTHRVGKPSPNKPRDIIVKFTSYRARQELYLCRKELKDHGFEKTFINEDLTAKRSALLFSARSLTKTGHLLGAWSSDGKILIKDRNSKIIKVNTASDLTAFKPAN